MGIWFSKTQLESQASESGHTHVAGLKRAIKHAAAIIDSLRSLLSMIT